MADLKILALDTSTTPCCAAVLSSGEDTALRSFVGLEEPRELSSQLMRLIDDALQGAGWTLDDLDLLAVGLGPGSWTGLRIGISAFKTLAQVRELPLCGASTFEALYRSVDNPHQHMMGIVAPSRPGEIYGAIGKNTQKTSDSRWINLWSPSEFAVSLSLKGPQPTVVGTDQTTLDEVAAELRNLPVPPKPHIVVPDTRSIIEALGAIAVERYQSGQTDDPLRVEPLYLAPSNAERAREAKLASASS